MISQELRRKFLKFFEKNNHKAVPSSSLIPKDDPTVLLTTAGMQQFKLYFKGDKNALDDFGNVNLASVQKCFRTSDIDAVGDESHDTFFEMMGNFSLGGYGKKEAIEYAWELMTNKAWFGLPKEKFFATVFSGDKEIPEDKDSEKYWKEIADGIEVKKFGREENFWPKPVWVGTCGPSSELHYKLDSGASLEVWNLVFTQYFHTEDDKFLDLGQVKIDTGMGLERLAMVSQNKKSIFETDLFWPLISAIGKSLLRKNYGEDHNFDCSFRIIADHIRGVCFTVADGVKPSNKDRGYIVRRLIRRAITQKYLYGDKQALTSDIVNSVVGIYKDSYPELVRQSQKIKKILDDEEKKFGIVLDAGMRELDKIGSSKVSAEAAFKLYESYGLPLDIMEELIRGNIDRKGFEKLFKKHQEISRQG